jgi:hypothetical protein
MEVNTATQKRKIPREWKVLSWRLFTMWSQGEQIVDSTTFAQTQK